MNVVQRNRTDMNNPTPHEIQAIQDASEAGGEYLNALGNANLLTMTSDEWMAFNEAVCTGFCESMRTRAGMVMMDINLNNGLPPLCVGDVS